LVHNVIDNVAQEHHAVTSLVDQFADHIIVSEILP
jgi:hypothetical protein